MAGEQTQPASRPAAPVFVGGTGRSGTTIVSRLIGQHPQYAFIPYEVRFHAEPMGLPGLLSGRTSVDEFLELMRSRWYRLTPQGREGGLQRIVAQPDFDRALERFTAAFEQDKVAACRNLLCEFLDPIAEQEGKPSWVEMTPRNVFHAAALLQMFPDMKLVHSVRDGRDTAGSLVAKNWAPDMIAGLEWWGSRLQAARRSTKRIPRDRLMVLRLEHLVEERRDASYDELLEFLGVSDDPGLRGFFDAQLTPERANIGRWKEQIRGPERERFLALHREIQERHRRRGDAARRS